MGLQILRSPVRFRLRPNGVLFYLYFFRGLRRENTGLIPSLSTGVLAEWLRRLIRNQLGTLPREFESLRRRLIFFFLAKENFSVFYQGRTARFSKPRLPYPWRNGQRIRLRIWGLRVRIPSGMSFLILNF